MKLPLSENFLLLLSIVCVIVGAGCAGDRDSETQSLKLSIVYNNEPFDEALKTEWGFSCLIEGLDQTILFDTGGDGETLLSNMDTIGISPGSADLVVLSHYHGDHTRGLEKMHEHNQAMIVYMPESFPQDFQQAVKDTGATVEPVTDPLVLFEGACSTGEMGNSIIEQSLILDAPSGLVIVTGCSHPGIVKIVRRARQVEDKEIDLVIGGFHLGRKPDDEVGDIIKELKDLGVKRVAPTHCTGNRAIELFREAWGDDFIDAGLGRVIEV